jgi:hypothetical protein
MYGRLQRLASQQWLQLMGLLLVAAWNSQWYVGPSPRMKLGRPFLALSVPFYIHFLVEYHEEVYIEVALF